VPHLIVLSSPLKRGWNYGQAWSLIFFLLFLPLWANSNKKAQGHFEFKPKNKKPEFHYLDLRLSVFLIHLSPSAKNMENEKGKE
jgi:hypothetical protein